jgi:hypothetical protein
LAQRLEEGGNDMGRRGEAPLAGLLHVRPLGMHVEADSEWLRPFAASSSLLRAMTKPKPGTPSMHLLADDTIAS